MTRPEQKSSERQALDAVLAALGLSPDQEPEHGEAPDFTVRVAGRTIGVEVTMYRYGATVDDGTERRSVENEWERLRDAANAFRDQQTDLLDLNVGLMFKGAVPPRRHHAAFLEEVAAFARDHAAEFGSQECEYWPPSFSTPLMQADLLPNLPSFTRRVCSGYAPDRGVPRTQSV